MRKEDIIGMILATPYALFWLSIWALVMMLPIIIIKALQFS